MSDTEKKPREWVLRWDYDFQYLDGVPAEIITATGDEIDEHKRVKAIEKSAYDALAKQVEELKAELAIMKSRASQFESRG